MDLSSKMEINRIYKQQDWVNKSVAELADFLKQRETLRDDLVKENYIMFLRLLGELYGQEYAMVRELKLVLAELREDSQD
ncbi:MAG: hypothetical protein WC271_11890 [Bacteroidales bacterium]|jgi:hypothetical protein|nr:hypothetical protein [Bacteroidales bacterium]MDY0202091.1 hypothetical protein [Tenuifilaceae bacterium]